MNINKSIFFPRGTNQTAVGDCWKRPCTLRLWFNTCGVTITAVQALRVVTSWSILSQHSCPVQASLSGLSTAVMAGKFSLGCCCCCWLLSSGTSHSPSCCCWLWWLWLRCYCQNIRKSCHDTTGRIISRIHPPHCIPP